MYRRREALTDRCDRAHFAAALSPPPRPCRRCRPVCAFAHTGMESARAALGHQETYLLKRGGMDVVAPRLHYMLCAARVYPPQP